MIGAVPIPLRFNDTELDTSFIETPKINGSHVPISMVGRFNPVGETLPFKNEDVMPFFDLKGESLQIYVSEFTFRSFAYTAQYLGYLTLTLGKYFLGFKIVCLV